MDCRDHNWMLAITERSTGPFLRCTFVCPCGTFRVVEMKEDNNELNLPLSEQLKAGRGKQQHESSQVPVHDVRGEPSGASEEAAEPLTN